VVTLSLREVIASTPRARIARLDLNDHQFDYAPGQAISIASQIAIICANSSSQRPLETLCPHPSKTASLKNFAWPTLRTKIQPTNSS